MSANRITEPVGGFSFGGIQYVSFECIVQAYGVTFEQIIVALHNRPFEVRRYRKQWFMASYDAIAHFSNHGYNQS